MNDYMTFEATLFILKLVFIFASVGGIVIMLMVLKNEQDNLVILKDINKDKINIK